MTANKSTYIVILLLAANLAACVYSMFILSTRDACVLPDPPIIQIK